MATELKPCPVCHGPASVGPAARANPAACGLGGWTADCQSGCEGAPYVTRFTRDDAVQAWNQLVDRRATPPSTSTAREVDDLPPLPEMDGLADIEYAQNTPDDWDDDYRATWQKLQVAERNKMQWRSYALKLHAALATTDAASRCRAQGGNTQADSSASVYVEAEQLALQLRHQHATDDWNWDSLLIAADMVETLAKARTQAEGAKDAEEITDEMADAGGESLYGHPRAKAREWAKEEKFDSCVYQARLIYRAMRAAATQKGEAA